MTVSKGWVMGLAGAAALLGAGLALADGGEDALAKQRQAYVKAAGRSVKGIPDTATVTALDPLGDHRIAVYAIDGHSNEIWLVTTDDGCPTPVPAEGRIVSYDANHQALPCRAVRIQTVDPTPLAAGFGPSRHQRPPGMAGNESAADLQVETSANAAVMTAGGLTR
ncbi:hypothetical protein [Dyella sedimenti]|uniref:hypothetical protein n=1 Tax=Dyella sedimenti TaxID=2919947 RepID=UPI001FAA5093|nr:hypothetical protein [Dyella sedimenti]